MNLSKPQLEAVETVNGQVILISCPGSGKTSTVVQRIKYMVEQGIPSNQILVMTFSKSAAMEMQERFVSLMNGRNEGVTFATIHSFCYNVIAPAYSLTAQNILRDNEGWMIVRKGLDYLKQKELLSMDIRDYSEFTSSCLREISVINNNGVDWVTYKAETCPTAEFHRIYDLYEEQKQHMGKIDFDDMLKLCYRLFTEQQDILEYYKSRFRYIIVDEYQDTNFLQRDILYLLAGNPEEANLCVVGDDDQSIYKFRGAKPEIMLGFAKEYPSCRQIYMDVNYRSQPCIVEHARKLIEHNRKRFKKDIKPFKSAEGIVSEKGYESSNSELFEMVEKMKALHESGMPFEDMAVLYRNNKQAGLLSVVLMNHDIPFHSNEPIPSPYRHWIFSDLISYYKLANGEGNAYDIMQVINKPNRFIPVNCLKRVVAEEKEVSRCVSKVQMDPWKKSKAIHEVHDFFLNLRFLKSQDPVSFIEMTLSMAGYLSYLKSYAAYRNMDVTELTGMIDSYKSDIRSNNITSVKEWIRFSKEVNERIDRLNADHSKNGAAISTMHKSKGLEWRSVFIIGANEGTIPSEKTVNSGNLEEERRLFYVAATRAKDQLYISYVENENAKPSRFVKEMMGDSQIPDKGKQQIKVKKGQKVIHEKYGDGTVIAVISGAAAVKFYKTAEILKFEKDSLSELQIK